MKKIVLLAAVAALFVGMLTVPAAAAPDDLDAGVVIGAAAVVSKGQSGGCADGTGGPIGLPVIDGVKKAYYSFDASTATLAQSARHGDISGLQLCGQLDAIAGLVGAACGGSSSQNGSGSVTAEDGTTFNFSDVGWAASGGSVFVATGHVSQGGKAGGVLALVSARGVGAQCLNKQSSGKTGAINFDVDFVYVAGQVIPAVKHTK